MSEPRVIRATMILTCLLVAVHASAQVSLGTLQDEAAVRKAAARNSASR